MTTRTIAAALALCAAAAGTGLAQSDTTTKKTTPPDTITKKTVTTRKMPMDTLGKAQRDSIKLAVRDSTNRVKTQRALLGRYTMTLPESLTTRATIAEPAAAMTALIRVEAGGRIQAVTLTDSTGKLVYVYDIKPPSGTGLKVITVDAMTGDVVSNVTMTAAEVRADPTRTPGKGRPVRTRTKAPVKP